MGYEDRRPKARDRGYNTAWDRATVEFRQFNPHCVGCAAIGVRERATLVDHVIPHKGDQRLFWDRTNWQPSCTWHHNAIKLMLERLYQRGELAAKELWLYSETAQKLTRQKYRAPVGLDGFSNRSD